MDGRSIWSSLKHAFAKDDGTTHTYTMVLRSLITEHIRYFCRLGERIAVAVDSQAEFALLDVKVYP
jgi:hypothetical protein